MEMKNKSIQRDTMELQNGPFFMVLPISMEENDYEN